MESGQISKDLAAQIMNITELEELIPQISVNVPLTYQNKQKILEAVSLENQYEMCIRDRCRTSDPWLW